MRAQSRRLRRAATGRGIAGRFSFFFFLFSYNHDGLLHPKH